MDTYWINGLLILASTLFPTNLLAGVYCFQCFIQENWISSVGYLIVVLLYSFVQVPLLLSIGEEDIALIKATECGDTDLVYLVLFHIWQKVMAMKKQYILNVVRFVMYIVQHDLISWTHSSFDDAETAIRVLWNYTSQSISTWVICNICTVCDLEPYFRSKTVWILLVI